MVKGLSLFLSFGLLLSSALIGIADQPALARRKYAGNYLVPPPPPYMPSILPELEYGKSKKKKKKAKRIEAVKKHIYFARGYEEPPPVRPNKNITYWNQKSTITKRVSGVWEIPPAPSIPPG